MIFVAYFESLTLSFVQHDLKSYGTSVAQDAISEASLEIQSASFAYDVQPPNTFLSTDIFSRNYDTTETEKV